ncbi:MAG TPA: GNAT family N-acetyltransferase [Candidatus Binataceae bacterium]|nr:GNAT family N-acetyltransferase [Candidatus Binataceae bacterium]
MASTSIPPGPAPDDSAAIARDYARHEVSRDGGSIFIRAIRSDDKERLLEHFRHLSAESVYHRFFGIKRTLTDDDLVRFTELDFVNHVGLVATLRDDGVERFIGDGRYMRMDKTRAEVAFAVLDEYQGRGIGTLLLEAMLGIARAAGITEFQADVLGDNNRMLEVFARMGFRVRRAIESGVVHLSFPTGETDESRSASRHREWSAAAESIRKLMNPRSVAVVGATRSPARIGGAIVANLKRGGFTGAIYPINSTADEILGLRAYPTVSAVGAPVDLAIIAIPAPAVRLALEDCAHAQVHSVVVITSGFAEVSPAGRAAQQGLFETARASGMRLVGPNCMGILNTAPDVQLNATFSPVRPLAGNIGMFSQSGALGIAVLDFMRSRGLGISNFVSAGNRAEVSNNDLLAYWMEDSATRVVVLYLENVGNPRKFAILAPEVARRKPIVAVKSGRSAAGSRAASSHSASLASLDIAVDALFEQAGVIRTDTLEQLFDVVAMLSSQPLPAGPRVGVVVNAGGPGVLLADACEARGLTLPPLDEATVAELRAFLPERAGLSNPVDMTTSADSAGYERALAAVGNDPNIDSIVALHVPATPAMGAIAAAAIARGAARIPEHKPFINIYLSTEQPPRILHEGPRGHLPSYSFPENAALVLAHAWRYGRWRAQPRGTPFTLSPFAMSAVRAVVDRVLAEAAEPLWMSPEDAALVLRAAGIEVALAERASIAEAAAVADHIGYPVVAKIVAPELTHKSDIGGVIIGLNSPLAVAEAAITIAERARAAGVRLDALLIQREIEGGIEALAGVTSDRTFGPLILCGMGGAMVELIHDVVFRLHPVTDTDAAAMIGALRSSRLLDGYRGSPPADRKALAALLQRASALVEAIPEMTDMDLNPVKLLAPGKGAIVIDARIRLSPISPLAPRPRSD